MTASVEAEGAPYGAEQQLEDLVRAARAGDRTALEAFLESIQRRVYLLAFRLLGDRRLAEDVAQEALLKICRRLGQYRERTNLWGWIYRIVVNQARDFRRRARLEASDPADCPAPPDYDPVREEQLRHVMAAMSLLSYKGRVALVLTDIQGLTSREAGKVLGCLAITVRTRAAQARKKVRHALSRYYPELRQVT